MIGQEVPEVEIKTPEKSPEPIVRQNFKYGPETAQQMARVASMAYFDMGKFGTKTVTEGPGDYKLEKSQVVKETNEGSQLLFTYQIVDEPHEYIKYQKGSNNNQTIVSGRLKTCEVIVEPYPPIPFHRNDPKRGTDLRKFISYTLKTFRGGGYWIETYEGEYHRNTTESRSAKSLVDEALNSKIDAQATHRVYIHDWENKRNSQDHIEKGTTSADRIVSDSFAPGKGGLPSQRL